MPEQDNKEKLIGETTVTSSSNEAIEATIAQLRREYHGLPDPEVVIEGEQYSPKSVSGTSTEPTLTEGTSSKVIDIISKLTHKNSALAYRIREKRLEKKAA